MLTDYTDLEKEIEDAPEPKLLTSGTEVKARIVLVNSDISEKNDCTWYMPTFDVPDDPMVMMFSDFFWHLDKEKLDPKDYQQTLYKFKQFAQAFGIDYSRPFSWEDDLPGLQGWLIVGIQKDKTGQHPDKNSVRKYVAPK